MKPYVWDNSKNEKLARERGVSFEDAVAAIERGRVLDMVRHTNQERYPNQKFYVVEINNYAYLVSYVEDETQVYLKTVYPSRKATQKYLRKAEGEKNGY